MKTGKLPVGMHERTRLGIHSTYYLEKWVTLLDPPLSCVVQLGRRALVLMQPEAEARGRSGDG
jgi:hypothetical protein